MSARSSMLSVALAGFVLAAACSKSTGSGSHPEGSVGGDPTTGGSGGGDGGASIGGTGGASIGGDGGASIGGTGGATLPVPKCLSDLFAACPLEGACVQTNAQASRVRSCFDNGTVEEFVSGAECGSNDVYVYKGDGSLCYSASRLAFAGHACEDAQITWHDAQGATVATGSAAPGSSFGPSAHIACAMSSEQSDCHATTTDGCRSDVWPHLAMCSPGACGDAGAGLPKDAGVPDAKP